MHLWQLDIVGGVFLVNGREHKMLTAIDDHSRFVVAAAVLRQPSGPAVCDAFLAAINRWVHLLRFSPTTASSSVEIDRTASRDGIVVVAGRDLALGTGVAGTRVTLRFDGGLIHATAGNMLLKTLPNPFSHKEVQQLKGARPAASPLPPPPPAGPQSVQRRIPKGGVVMVAGQVCVSAEHMSGPIVTVVVDDHHFRVLDGTKELSLHARTSTKPIRNFNAHRARQR